ncbi:MAG: sugar phosphate isomerase/epimerase [Rhodospirillaceae bacterium]|nr:sugar phosphate isomerase/epimerase [Rhodospirillaceae bacterium]
MQLSVSQIAWDSGRDPAFFGLLAAADFHGIDIAPTKIWSDWVVSDASLTDYKHTLGAHGMTGVGMQSIFFGTKGLNVFGDDASWQAVSRHFTLVCRIAGELGVKAVVFGAPANRDPGERSASEINPLAQERFAHMGDVAKREGTCLCLEPVPADLGSKFLRTTTETAAFVRALAHPAVKMNLDTAVLVAEGCDAAGTRAAVLENLDVIGHVHASEPQLGPFAAPRGLHNHVARALHDGGYTGGVAIEMRADADIVRSRANLIEALAFVGRVYRVH